MKFHQVTGEKIMNDQEQQESAGYSLPIWVWGTTAFIAGYMMLQLQCGA